MTTSPLARFHALGISFPPLLRLSPVYLSYANDETLTLHAITRTVRFDSRSGQPIEIENLDDEIDSLSRDL